jgi:hypothetical protein
MHIQLTFSDFCDAFRTMDRDNQFTYAGKRALFDYIEDYEAQTGEPIELDIIALCCEYTEADYAEIAEMYSIEADDEEDIEEAVWAHLEDHTIIVGKVPGGLVFCSDF